MSPPASRSSAVKGQSSLDTPPIPPTVKGLALVSLFNDFSSEMVYPLLPAFVTGTLGAGPTLLAAVDGAAELAAAATKWISGELADRVRWRKPLIVAGYFSAILVRPLMGMTAAGWQVISLRALDRVGKGVRTPARDAMIADATPPEIRGRAFGFHRAADHFGSIPGSLLAWWLLSHTVDVRKVLAWSAAPGVLAGLVLLVVLRSAPVRPHAHSDAPAATGRTFWAPVIALALLTLARLPETLLLLRLSQLGIATALIPLVWAGLHVVRSGLSYPGGRLTDHLGPRSVVAAGGGLFAAGAALLGQALASATAVVVFLALGVVSALMEPAERTLVARLAPRRTGRAFGAYHALTGVAALPAALLLGAVYQDRGGGAALQLSATLVVAATIAWVMVAPRANGGR
jgi:MFS family permease